MIQLWLYFSSFRCIFTSREYAVSLQEFRERSLWLSGTFLHWVIRQVRTKYLPCQIFRTCLPCQGNLCFVLIKVQGRTSFFVVLGGVLHTSVRVLGPFPTVYMSYVGSLPLLHSMHRLHWGFPINSAWLQHASILLILSQPEFIRFHKIPRTLEKYSLLV